MGLTALSGNRQHQGSPLRRTHFQDQPNDEPTLRDVMNQLTGMDSRLSALENPSVGGLGGGLGVPQRRMGSQHAVTGPVQQQMGGANTMPFTPHMGGMGATYGAMQPPPGFFHQQAPPLNLDTLDHETSMRMSRGTAAVAELVTHAEQYPEQTIQTFEQIVARECGVYWVGQPWSTEKHVDVLIATLADKHKCLKRTLAMLGRIYELQRHLEHNPNVARAFTARCIQVGTMAAQHDGQWEVGWDLLGMKDPLTTIPRPLLSTPQQVAVVAMQREKAQLAEAIQRVSKSGSGAASSSAAAPKKSVEEG
jgi:hypothetical protein